MATLALALVLVTTGAAAQGRDSSRAARAAARAARHAQTRFEAARVQFLPDAPGGGAGDRCDVRIGRFCHWYDEAEPDPPPEPSRIAQARERLLRSLDSAAADAPHDAWISGQRVRYLIEAGHPRDARTVAQRCTAIEPGWCATLVGLAAHADGDGAAADSAFTDALAHFPVAERCRWTDLTLMIDGPLRDRYRRSSCAGRDSLDHRIWWLAEPLYSRSAVSVRAEHFARLTMARLQQATRTPLEPTWGDDLREMIVRYGWPTAYSRDRGRESMSLGSGYPARVIGHEPHPSYYFFPDVRAVNQPQTAQPDDWQLTAPRALARYAPGTRIDALLHQSAWFRRGDSTLVLAAYARAADTVLARSAVESTLILWRDDRTAPVIARTTSDTSSTERARRVLLTAAAPWHPALVGVEVLARDRPYAARARYGLGARPASTISLSSILLFDPTDTLPSSLDGAFPAMRPTDRAQRGERVGLLWEVYGLPDTAAAVTMSLSTERTSGAPLARRAAEALGLRRRPAPVRLRWGTRASNTAGVATGAITLRLDDLTPGRYRITIDVRSQAGDVATSAREITIAGR